MLKYIILSLSLFINNLTTSSFAYKYNYDPRIHMFGNIGFGGTVHSLIAYPFTKAIDMNVYNGVNIRKKINNRFIKKDNVLDLCCGIGMSTKYYGIDSSPEMIRMAQILNYRNKQKKFIIADVENYIPPIKFEHCTIMFAFHEIPEYARINILKNTINNIVTKSIIIVDIATNYTPHNLMLLGEPFILEYQSNIDKNIFNLPNLLNTNLDISKEILIPNHVESWTINLI